MRERPGPCAYCDDGKHRVPCVGVAIEGTPLREHYRCTQYRRWWDAGRAAGVAQEREAQAVGAQPVPGKVWI